jgi:hypothetical protein
MKRIVRARAINLRAECTQLPGLTGRTPETTGEALEGTAFGPTYPYRDGFVSTVKFSGTSGWERHPGEELLLIAEGTGFLHLIDTDGFDVPRALSPTFWLSCRPRHGTKSSPIPASRSSP